MNPPKIRKLYKTNRDYILRDKQLHVLDMDDISNWLKANMNFLLVSAEQSHANEHGTSNWVLHIIYGEKIGYIFTFDEQWENEFSLLVEPKESV